MLTWTKTVQPNGNHSWQIHDTAAHIADAGYSLGGKRAGRAAIETGFHHYFVASGGRRIWFDDESALKAFVDEVFQAQLALNIEDRHQAVLVGMMWAHDIAYKFDKPDESVPLPMVFPGGSDEVAGKLLDRSPRHIQASTPIVVAAANAAWNYLRMQPIETRPFPILQ